MSLKFDSKTSAPVKFFRGVNGQRINLSERSDVDKNEKHQTRVIEFELRSESQPANFCIDIPILLVIILLWSTIAHQLLITTLTVLYAVFRCKSILSSIKADTLLVVESVGIQIIRKQVLSYFEFTTFLPWNTVKDVFINEVITGNRVLYFLTFIVRDTSCGKEETKLVPLFCDLKPERKCLEYISRDSKKFNYGKELMKVIRRIIKSQPRQGQQFGTHHLLVTYNHSPWTRQDKMFAMLKFRDRTDASAFPRAFILTVKLLTTVSTANNEEEYDDELIIYKKCTDNSQWNDSKQQNSDANAKEQTGQRPRSSTISTDDTSNDSSTRLTPINSIKMKVNNNSSKTTKHSNRSQQNLSASFFADIDDLPLLERYLLEQDQHEKSSRQPSPSESTHHERLTDIQDTVDMPYQYLIEREIERTKKKMVDHSRKQENLTIGKANTKSSSEHSNTETSLPRNRTNSANIIDNATARSADITDLVMEGLMFTIRQDQDTITVMEQKTKLEPDEVLENSEKAETKEGSECLVNSSLLKLENLITKIDRSSSASKSIPRYYENYGSAFPITPFYKVGGSFAENNQTYANKPYDTRNEDRTGFNLGLSGNKSTGNSFIAPKTFRQPFKSHNEQLNGCNLYPNEINLSNVQNVYNGIINDNDYVNPLSVETRSIDEPMKESESGDTESHENLDDPSTQLNRTIEAGTLINNSEKSENKGGQNESEIMQNIKTIDYHVESTSPTAIPDLLMDDIQLHSTPSTNTSRIKLNMPRIISTEIVEYDLSLLRAPRLRKRVDLNEDSNNSISNEDKHTESFSNTNTLSQNESQQSNEKNAENMTTTNRRRLIAKRRLHGQKSDDNLDTTIEMWKFVQDMTQGVRVVLQRLDLTSISTGTGKNC